MVVAVEGIVRNGRGDVLLTSLVSSGSSETVARVGRVVAGVVLGLDGGLLGDLGLLLSGDDGSDVAVRLSNKVGGGGGVPRRVVAVLGKVLLGGLLVLVVSRASGAVSGLLLYLLLSNSSNGSGVVTGEVAVGIGSVVIAGIFVAIARVSLEGGSGSGKVGGRGVPRRVIAILEKVLLGSFLILFGSEDASGQGDQNQKAL